MDEMFSPNDVYIEELYYQYLRDPNSVSPEWQDYFRRTTTTPLRQSTASVENGKQTPAPEQTVRLSSSGATIPATSAAPTTVQPQSPTASGDSLHALSGIQERIAQNMNRSLTVPTATSVRSIPIKALEENRLLLNEFLQKRRKKKLSYTHIIGWAIVRALRKYPHMNDACVVGQDGKYYRVHHSSVNLGLAVDTVKGDGTRVLVVPSIKNADEMTFAEFVEHYDMLIEKARVGKLSIEELTGATITLTNPGMIGTAMSMPRLMEGQGVIIATGAIGYPAEFSAVMPDVLVTLAVSKVMTITSTYDHRIIQGAESGEFLQYIEHLLKGGDNFYDQIFAALKIPFEPYRWSTDNRLDPFGPQEKEEQLEKETLVNKLINAYRVRGHLSADINPLGYEAFYYPELQLSYYGLTIWDLDRQFDTGGLGGVKRAPLREILRMLRDSYCGQIGIEFMHIQSPEQKFWIQEYVESGRLRRTLTPEERRRIYRKLLESELLETFINTKFIGAKRFSIEGGESFIPTLEYLLLSASRAGLNGAVLGMAHRGRLNVLVNIMGKAPEKLFNEFEGILDPDSVQGSGDVKYHLGSQAIFSTEGGKPVPVVLAPNPSHLEAVNPVVEGMARALCDEAGDRSYSTVLPILVHGDAAFAGQGVVQETLNMMRLRGYRTGGTIHIIINNQIGFTTSPEDARSTPYASGIAKFIQVPVLHVNGDSPEACIAAAEFAFAYRQQFGDDVVIDIYCYRKYGHNEGDDPTATQPLLYRAIRNHKPVRQLYRELLVADGVLTPDEGDRMAEEYSTMLQKAFDRRKASISTRDARLSPTIELFEPVSTAVPHETLRFIGERITTVPEGFNVHPKVADELARRRQQVTNSDSMVSWGMAEALAFGSLLLEHKPIRLTGQDSERGTFNHRQAVLHDYETDATYIPLNHIAPDQERFHIYNSPLSEYAVLGFEYGYSTIRTRGLTLWEAQFGDFANGAQIVIDQFISSGEVKWGQISNLVLLLPHGYDGQGPEHSSARLERYLQLCAENNMLVCFLTTPSQLFHALRRQVHARWRKPLVLLTPKGYLRKVHSPLHELAEGRFREILDDQTITTPAAVERIVLCSGMFYYELLAKRAALDLDDRVAIVRIEQLYPLATDQIGAMLSRYSNVRDIVWAQEEPMNMGAWSYMMQQLLPIIGRQRRLLYAGRPAAASPATGSFLVHNREQEHILNAAFAPVDTASDSSPLVAFDCSGGN
ncbi:MAG: multifunctional oxoglutarate decarboxylase/oxoglutarate dehydrogenase thiamine pyrophosphate-binding subunit/dihydrolipoyllysine-residue succinyltransferase subunit [Chlorobi bacterium]|nr:multifunctional oxoglutarate decarboxylase/oxoglutarate dehydrogenase thiamine pyrophosphate-binding subunit/dihydrolipoyllysine-residue succinyltransferase subunit [Chlorobiota bacterium]